MKFATALILATSKAVEFGYDDYAHAHTEYGEETQFRDIEVVYDEIEYSIDHKTETEVRTRQIPITTEFSQTDTKYRPDEEMRYTSNYEIKYRPNDYTRHTFEPRVEYGFY
jgi:hypothetical protein